MNKNAFQMDRRRALTSRGFAASAAGLAAAGFFGVFEQMLPVFMGEYAGTGLERGFTMQLLLTAFSSDLVMLALPVLCSLPFAAAFLEDYKSRFLRQYLPRAGKRDYINARTAVTALAGGLSLLAGMAVTAGLFFLLFLPQETVAAESGMLSFYAAACLGKGILFFLSGCFWSLVGGILAAVTMNRYMAYASPFIFYYMLVILSERYFRNIYVLNPKEWINPGDDWLGGFWGAAVLTAELTCAAAFCYQIVMERRLRDV